MSVLTGVITNLGRTTLAKSWGFLAGYPTTYPAYFKIGMGGYITTAAGRSPKDPDPTKTNIEADGSAGNYYFQKSLQATDFTFLPDSTMQIRCRLEPGEANDDGTGNAPRFFEVGVFDQNNNLLVYATFAEQTKAANKILSNSVQAYF